MKSVIYLLLGLAVGPAFAENAPTPAKPLITPAALLKSADENNAAKKAQAEETLAPPPEGPREVASPRGPQPGEPGLLPPPPPIEAQSNATVPNVAIAPPVPAAKAPASIPAKPATAPLPAKAAAIPAPHDSAPALPNVPGAIVPPAPLPKKALANDFAGPDIAVILARNQFYPSSIRLHAGNTTRLIFTTVNRKPGALILERLQVQRWIPGEPAPAPLTEGERAKMEVDRELNAQKITEVIIDPKPGDYTFYDALSGAAGEIVVE